VILQGTMQDGTVIPVQVDAQGRLVAEGLPGPAGPPGPEGPAGGSASDPSQLARLPYPPLATDLMVAWRTGTRYAIPLGDIFPDLLGAHESSPITTVTDIPAIDYVQSIIAYGAVPAGWDQRAEWFDGSTTPLRQLDDNNGPAGFKFAVPVVGVFRFFIAATSHGSLPSTWSLRINGTATYHANSTTGGWVSVNETAITTVEGNNQSGGGTYLGAIEQSGALMIGSARYMDLVVQDSAGLSSFKPGDQVVAINGTSGQLETGTGGIVEVNLQTRTVRIAAPSGNWAAGFVIRKYI
jgi:hypothetical protein